MEYIVYAVGLIIVGFAAFQVWMIRKNGNFTEQGWAEIRVIAYDAISQLMQLYTVKTDKEAFVEFVITSIKDEIDESENVTDIDKAFWSEDRLRAILKPVIEGLIAKIKG
jgi:hypothetical protein